MPIRHYTREQLAALGVPPDSPNDIQYDPDFLADEHVATLKFTAKRRCISRDGEKTYAVEYEAPLDMGDYEVDAGAPEDNGWHGATVEAVEVEQQPVTVIRWVPVQDGAQA